MVRPIYKVQFGCSSGSNKKIIPGWFNLDLDECCIYKALPFPDKSIQFAYCERVLNGLNLASMFKFFNEIKRCLVPGGVARMVFVDFDKILTHQNLEYEAFIRKTFGCSSVNAFCTRLQIVQPLTYEVVDNLLKRIGFKTKQQAFKESIYPELSGLEMRSKDFPDESFYMVDSSIVEATKVI